MLFTTFAFLAFFVVVFPIYWVLPVQRLRLAWLLGSSIVFYSGLDGWLWLVGLNPTFEHSWARWTISLVLGNAIIDFALAPYLQPGSNSERTRKWLTILAVVKSLGCLCYFKYANFFLSSISAILTQAGMTSSIPLLQLLLPLGISFYTFESISYVIEVYRGKVTPERDFLKYGLYLLFFPRLIAGPIVRPHEFLPQLSKLQQWSWNRGLWGVQLFMLGFIKKAVIADRLSAVVEPVFNTPEAYSTLAVWVATLAYSIQIYCDFSGYSDMAIGLGHLFGLKLPVNFRFPYLALDIADFWRRWHLSLSAWLSTYLYKPLGGHRHGLTRTCRNLFLVMFLGGLWHGAQWTFVAWGFYHGILLMLHRVIRWPAWLKHPMAKPCCWLVTFLFISWGRILFRADSFATAGTLLHRTFVPTAGSNLKPGYYLITLVGVLFLVIDHGLLSKVRPLTLSQRWPAPVVGAGLAMCSIYALLFMPDFVKIFIYFQF